MFFKVKQLNEQKPTAPASPTIAPVCDTNLPSTVTDEVAKVLYFGFGSFLAVSLIALAVLQVNINSVCDKNLDEVNGLSALLSLFMALLCSIISFVPSQRDIITKAFKYYELPSYKKESLWSWINIGLFILIPTLVVIHDVGGFIAISESNTCKRTAPGLFIGTSIVLSFQLLIILMLMLALFYSRMMDLIYSLPSFNIDLISELHVTLKAKKLLLLIFDSICPLFGRITKVLKKEYILSKIKETYFNIICKFMEIVNNIFNCISIKIPGILKSRTSILRSKIQDFLESIRACNLLDSIKNINENISIRCKSTIKYIKENVTGKFHSEAKRKT